MRQTTPRWFDDPDKVLELIPFLVTIHGMDAREIVDYVSRPWKWEDQWQEYSHYDELLAAQNDDLF